MSKRVRKYFDSPPPENWAPIFFALPSYHLRAQILRTLLGAWITHRRIGQPARPCVFGCPDCNDELQHYVDCSPLLLAVSRFFHGFLAYMTPAALLCLNSPPSPPQLAGVAIACLAYHTLRHHDKVPMEMLHSTIRALISSDVNLYRLNTLHARRRNPPSRRDERPNSPPSGPPPPPLDRIVENDTDIDIRNLQIPPSNIVVSSFSDAVGEVRTEVGTAASSLSHAPMGSLRTDLSSVCAPPLDGRVEQDSELSHSFRGNLCGIGATSHS